MRPSVVILCLFLLSAYADQQPNVVQVHSFSDQLLRVKENSVRVLSDYMTGFNLSFTVDDTSVASIQPGLKALATGDFSQGFVPGNQRIISQTYPRNMVGGINYGQHVLYLTSNNYLYWATLDNTTTVPNLQQGISITDLKNTHCYGATLLSSELAVVDCFTNDTSPLDWFIFVDLKTPAIVTSVSKPASAITTFDAVSGRANRGVKFVDFGNGNRLLFRYVGGDAFCQS